MSTWSGIEEFYSVAQARSFTQAARRLGLSASQVSREVAQLEDRLGKRLLYRSTRHVSLTEAGEQFFGRCRRLLEDRDEALAAMLNESSHLNGELRMTCSERFVVPMINRFMHRHPHLGVYILLANGVIDLVDHGLDLAVRFGHLNDSRLVATRLGSRTRYLCAAPAYLERRGRPEHPRDLLGAYVGLSLVNHFGHRLLVSPKEPDSYVSMIIYRVPQKSRAFRAARFKKNRNGAFVHVLRDVDYFEICHHFVTPAELVDYFSFRRDILLSWDPPSTAVSESALIGQYLLEDF